MNRVKVKTREQVKSVKTMDRAAVAGMRMKNAYIHTRETAMRNREDRNSSPTSYAGDRAQEYARSMARNAARTARFGGKVVRQKGGLTLQRYRDSRDGAPPAEHDFTPPKGAAYKEIPLEGDAPLSSRQNPVAQRQQYRRYFYRIKKAPLQEHGEEDGVSPYAPTSNHVTERGREFAKKQAAKRSKVVQEIKTKEALTAIRQKDNSIDLLSQEVGSDGVKEIPFEMGKGRAVPLPAKMVVREKAAPPLIFGTGGKNVRRIAFQPTKHSPSLQAVQRAEKVSREAVKLAERAEKASRFAAKSAAAAAKKTAKASAAAIKGILAAAKTLAAAIAAGGWVAVLVVVVICLIGQLACSGLGIFFAGEDSGTGQTVATAVQEIDREFGERLAEVQASVDYDILDMSGSPAPWPDVLAVYAVKTTSDPDNGLEVVTMDDARKELLRGVFWEMNSISSSVTVRTSEVSSTTTDENGNTVETTETETEVTLHITISHRTAREMADAYRFDAHQREQLDFLLSAENSGLWDALLQGAGAGAGGGNGGDLVSVALSQVGNVGGQPYWSWYGFESQVEWCACFVSWCANESGCLGTSIPKFSRCIDGVAWFQGQGRWQSSGYLPQPGDVIFFDWNGDMVPDHVGIVEKVESGVIYTIEGNSAGDRCRENRYAVGSEWIYGYGRFLT